MPKLEAYDRSLPYAYAPGIFPAMECLHVCPERCLRLLVSSAGERSEGVQRLVRESEMAGIRVETADRVLARIAHKDNCFAAMVFDKWEASLHADAPHVVLHHPSDGGNLGTILRTCLGFGFRDLAIVRPAVDHFDPRVVRASMGALFSMRVRHYDDIEDYRTAFAGHALYPFMLTGAIELSKAAAQAGAPYALVFGNEASGLPEAFARMGTSVLIPHSGAIDSLNLAVAVGIGAYTFAQSDANRRQ